MTISPFSLFDGLRQLVWKDAEGRKFRSGRFQSSTTGGKYAHPDFL
jgi:hypothetical protein